MSIKIEIQPQDLNTLHVFFFTATQEGTSQNVIFNRLFQELDKQVKKQYGIAYAGHIQNIRKEVEKQRKNVKS